MTEENFWKILNYCGLNYQDAANILGYHRNTLNKWKREGFPKNWHLKVQPILDYFENHCKSILEKNEHLRLHIESDGDFHEKTPITIDNFISIFKNIGTTTLEAAYLMEVSAMTVDKYKNRGVPTNWKRKAKPLFDFYDVEVRNMLSMYMELFAVSKHENSLVRKEPLPQVTEVEEGREIPYVDTSVAASFGTAMVDAVRIDDSINMKIPSFVRGELVVPVHGHSMKGYINHGDDIIIRRITDKRSIIYGEPYAVVTRADNMRTVKFINEHEDPEKLWLSVYNVEQFNSQAYLWEDIDQVWQVIAIIRRVGV